MFGLAIGVLASLAMASPNASGADTDLRALLDGLPACMDPTDCIPDPTVETRPPPPLAPDGKRLQAEPFGWAPHVFAPLSLQPAPVPRWTVQVDHHTPYRPPKAWWAEQGLAVPGVAQDAPGVAVLPEAVRAWGSRRVVRQEGLWLSLVGDTVAVFRDGDPGPWRVVRIPGVRSPPGDWPDAPPLRLTWAAVVDGALVVATSHRGYAATTGGQTGHLLAVDLDTAAYRWVSPPRVCNAETFVVLPAGILCGYGFSREPDRLVLVDPRDGTVRWSRAVASAPRWIVVDKGGVVRVRTYGEEVRLVVGR